MRKDNLHRALQQPELLSEEQLQELRETVARFPYFGVAQIALSQAYKVKGDHRFSDQLSQAAIYTSNRASLYQRLKKISPTDQTTDLVNAQTPQYNPEHTPRELASAIVEDEATASETVVAKFESTSVITEPRFDMPSLLPSEAIIAAEEQEEIEIEIEEVIEEVEVAEEQKELQPIIDLRAMDPLDAQILVGAVQKSIEMEVQPEHEAEDTTDKADTDLTPDDENSFAALIYRRAQRLKHDALEEEEATEDDNPSDDEIDSDLPAFQSTPLSHGIQRIKTTGGKQHQRDLIDRFIHLEPQIARGKASDYASGNIAKESLEEDFSFVTETMAVLFAKQGKLDKARKAFRKLMEQHPEKSIYFAAQLKNLEHLKK